MEKAAMSSDDPTPTAKAVTCPSCGHALDEGKAHGFHDYKEMKLQLDGYLKPGEKLHRNMLFDSLYANVPKDPQLHVQFYNYEIAPKGFTNWHIHTGATFYLTLQGEFEGHFQEGVLIEGKAGQVYSEPIGKPHRGHNPNPEVPLLGIGVALTTPGVDPIINIEPPAWAK
jgi:quercetin dioxygenase-like cupin family protein